MSPGNRPNQLSAPAHTSRPTSTTTIPARRWSDRQKRSSLDQPLPGGVDVVGVRRLLPCRPHVRCDLAPMVRRVDGDMGENLLDHAAPYLTLAVGVLHWAFAVARSSRGGQQLCQLLRSAFAV